jgi:hypothetical protein
MKAFTQFKSDYDRKYTVSSGNRLGTYQYNRPPQLRQLQQRQPRPSKPNQSPWRLRDSSASRGHLPIQVFTVATTLPGTIPASKDTAWIISRERFQQNTYGTFTDFTSAAKYARSCCRIFPTHSSSPSKTALAYRSTKPEPWFHILQSLKPSIMRRLFTCEVKIGLTVVAALVVFFWGMNYLKGINLFKLTIIIRQLLQVDGLVKSSPVMLDGFLVGLVRDIQYRYDHPATFCHPESEPQTPPPCG